MRDGDLAKADQLIEAGNGELGRLGAEQQAALESLVMGKSMAETARSAGVSRMAIWRWMKHDAAFQAAYNQWHEQLRDSCHSRLQALTEKAADAVERALEGGDARTALQLLKGMGMIREKTIGPTDEEEAKKVLAMEDKRRGLRIRREEARLREEDLTADSGF